MRKLDETLERLGSDYVNGYGLAEIPSPIDDEVSDLVSSVVAIDVGGREAVLSKMDESHGFLLLAFAERMAARTVRERQPDFAAAGLTAAAIAGALVYIKEALPIVSLLYDSIERIGFDPRVIFAGVPRFGNAELDEFIDHFPDRTKDDRRIEVMGYVGIEDQGGFRYERTW